jgi:hypothetical protein
LVDVGFFFLSKTSLCFSVKQIEYLLILTRTWQLYCRKCLHSLQYPTSAASLRSGVKDTPCMISIFSTVSICGNEMNTICYVWILNFYVWWRFAVNSGDKKVKGTFDTITCYEGTEKEWRYNSTLSLTRGLSEGGCLTPCLGLFIFENDWYPLYRRLDGPQGVSGCLQKILPPPGLDPWTV